VAQGLLNLTAAAVTAAVLLVGLVAVLVLWFSLLYLWFILLPALLELPALWDTLSLCWPFLVACGLALLIARVSRFHEPPAPDPMPADRATRRRNMHCAANGSRAEAVANEPTPD
jgi:hypothetical protein